MMIDNKTEQQLESTKQQNVVFISGVAGLLGSQFALWLLKNTDCIIVSVDNLSGGLLENLARLKEHSTRFYFYQYDLVTDQSNINTLFTQFDIQYIYHFACYAAEGLSPFIRKFNYQNNVVATSTLINCAIEHNIKRFIFTSSMAVYGENSTPFHEDSTPTPIDPYGVAKYACEMDLEIAYRQHGLEYTILRPHNVYGIGQNIFDPYRNVLGIWMWQSLNNKPLTIYGSGEQIRAFTCIDNILPCIYRSAISKETKCQVINLGGKVPKTINEMSQLIQKITHNTNVIYLEQRHEAKEAWSTYDKSVDLLDYKEDISLEQGLVLMWNWCKTLKLRPRKLWNEFELTKGLYSYWRT